MANTDLDYIEQQLAATTLSWPQMVKRYGADWHGWPPVTKWFQALTRLETLRTIDPPPPPPPPPAPVESPDNTVVKDTAGQIVDGSGHVWKISAAGKVNVDGSDDPITSGVVELAYESKKIWQKNSSGFWWYKLAPGDAWLPAGGTTVSPVPGDTPAPAPAPRMALGLTSDLNGWTGLRQPALDYGLRWFREEPSAGVVSWAHGAGAKIIGIYRNGNGTGTANSVALTCDYVESSNEFWWNGTALNEAAMLKQFSADADAAHAAGKPYLLSLLAWSGKASLVGSQPFDASGNWKGKPWTQWVTENAPELWAKCAGFAVHPYSPGQAFTNACMDTVRAQLEKIPGAAGKPFYVTEFGQASGPASDAWSAGSEQTQSDRVASQIDLMRARGDVAVACLYRWNDLSYTNSEGFYGMVRSDGSQKPVYAAVKARI